MGSLEGIISVGKWGGPGGNPWSFKASGAITEIIINENVNIKSISFKDASGFISGKFGGRDPNDQGEEKKIQISWPSEYLKSISGTYGDYFGMSAIMSLSFTTNLTSYGRFGTTSGEAFSLPIADGVVVGFHGRSGNYLDALGIFVQPGSLEGIISLGKWGGPGGDPWSFKARGGITEIVINESVNIKSISFKDASGFISGKFGGRDPNHLGAEKKVEIRWPSEYLKSISGTYGDYYGMSVIMSLSFTTNLTSYGPFGTTSGEAFSLPIADCVIVGFHGRSGNFLDALGIFVQPDDSQGSISFGPWGGSGGEDPFSFTVGSSINEIIVHVGDNIKSIAFKDANGSEYGKFGGNNPNDTGEEKTIEIDGNLEHLTSISGTYGNFGGMTVITSLSFLTNLNTLGPFGTASGTSFSIPILQGALVSGFHGRAGDYLDAIGMHVKPWDDVAGTISLGPWGGPGGNPWSHKTNRGISQIIINVGSNVKSISFQDTTGLNSGTVGGKHPNDTGERKIVNINWPSEHLISISGTYGDFVSLLTITSLSFTTNLATYGPFGTTSGTSFSIPVSNNEVVGFYGRAGYYLDAIGIFVKRETAI